MNFNFKLEKVLNYKRTIEDLKKNQYGVVQQRLNSEESKLDDFNRYKKNLLDEKNSTATKTKVGNLAMYSTYIEDVNTRIKEQAEVVTEIQKELEEKKEEMITAVQEKKIFEKLKENEYEKHLYEIKKREEKQNDAIISYKVSTQ
ncbi:flagellar export protein FliJ [Schnuerera ultunensis]|uniref:Flagellar FliJ protein n=1 Tax=[Clostridium] ultunense Esp TaxID=1288971 RepID=A0A1M4PNE3_9FIRM|nr:flagellar export protein FliJ [Schnuerera ultunensis]SHD77013.1 putative Flagellar export protein FliJ [[Clostridium] ultunense Esp]